MLKEVSSNSPRGPGSASRRVIVPSTSSSSEFSISSDGRASLSLGVLERPRSQSNSFTEPLLNKLSSAPNPASTPLHRPIQSNSQQLGDAFSSSVKIHDRKVSKPVSSPSPNLFSDLLNDRARLPLTSSNGEREVYERQEALTALLEYVKSAESATAEGEDYNRSSHVSSSLNSSIISNSSTASSAPLLPVGTPRLRGTSSPRSEDIDEGDEADCDLNLSPGRAMLREFTMASPSPKRPRNRSNTVLQPEPPVTASPAPPVLPFSLSETSLPSPVELAQSLVPLLESAKYLPDGWLKVLTRLVEEGKTALHGDIKGRSRIAEVIEWAERESDGRALNSKKDSSRKRPRGSDASSLMDWNRPWEHLASSTGSTEPPCLHFDFSPSMPSRNASDVLSSFGQSPTLTDADLNSSVSSSAKYEPAIIKAGTPFLTGSSTPLEPTFASPFEPPVADVVAEDPSAKMEGAEPSAFETQPPPPPPRRRPGRPKGSKTKRKIAGEVEYVPY